VEAAAVVAVPRAPTLLPYALLQHPWCSTASQVDVAMIVAQEVAAAEATHPPLDTPPVTLHRLATTRVSPQ